MAKQTPSSGPESRDAVVQVALALPLRQTFSYRVPEAFPVPEAGCRVRVGFARTHLVGYVVEDPGAEPPEKLRPLEAVLDREPLFSSQMLAFTRWIADYYLVSWGSVLKCAYPSGLDPSPRSSYELADAEELPGDHPLAGIATFLKAGPRSLPTLRAKFGPLAESLLQQGVRDGLFVEKTQWKTRRRFGGGDRVALLLGPDRMEALLDDPATPTLHAKVLKVLVDYETRGFPTIAQAAAKAKVPQYVLSEMAEAGWVELFDLLPVRLKGTTSPHVLTPAQASAVEAVGMAMEAGRHETFLLFGITGSGKTEVYLRLIEKALAAGGTALYLVPEISLTSFLARRLLERFGSDLAILHSSMTEHERVRQWMRASSGGARVVIGPRSALFAPLSDVRLLIVDEEHDGSFKQQDFPRYHARDMAVLRGVQAGIPVVLGSATPSVESFYNATDGGKYTLLSLPERTGTAKLPPVRVVDMREEFREAGGRTTLSSALRETMTETVEQGRQAIVLRNRLGFATFVLCRECGRTVQCDECSVAMTFHRRANRMKCHYCGRQGHVPEVCPACGGEVLQFLGEGTEKVEDALAEAFPGVRVARMDRDAVRTARAFDAIWRDFESGKIAVLAGTQMVAKGHDIPNVTLVGILSADFLLGMPDFRAAERTFQLITQAAGRAGRGRLPGQVVLQSFHPDHYAVQAARDHDFETFYERDIRYRRMVGYPPVGALARIEFRHPDKGKVDLMGRQAEASLRAAGDREVRILGPVEPPLARLEGRYRVHILLKAPERQRLRAVLAAFLQGPLGARNGREMTVEIDPYVLM